MPGPKSFSIGKVVYGSSVEEFIELLAHSGLLAGSTSCKTFKLSAEFKFSDDSTAISDTNVILPPGASITVWPWKLKDREHDAHFATARFDNVTVSVWIRKGAVKTIRLEQPRSAKPAYMRFRGVVPPRAD